VAIFKGCACIGINDGVGHWLGKNWWYWLSENMVSFLLLAIALFGARVVAMRSRAACWRARFWCWRCCNFRSASSRRVDWATWRLHWFRYCRRRIIRKWRKSVVGEHRFWREYSWLLGLARKFSSDLASVARGACGGKCCAAWRHPRRSCSGG